MVCRSPLTFVPDPSNPAVTPGSAVTDAQGAYSAMYRDQSGLAPGKYHVLSDG